MKFQDYKEVCKFKIREPLLCASQVTDKSQEETGNEKAYVLQMDSTDTVSGLDVPVWDYH
jgi:hypothetical protein